MSKRRARSQTTNLTSDHKKSGIDLFLMSPQGVRHDVGKLSTRATTLVETSSRFEFGARSYECPKLRDSNLGQFRDSNLGVSRKKSHLDVSSAESYKVYYMGEGGGFPPSPGRGESCVLKCSWLVPTPKGVPEC
jgi:hypothetical protein